MMYSNKTYRGKITYLMPVAIFEVLVFMFIWDLNIDAIVISFAVFIFTIIFPLGYKLTITNEGIIQQYLGIQIFNIRINHIQSYIYGPIGLWGNTGSYKVILHGKGLIILANSNGLWGNFGISEKLYGKDAIKHFIRGVGKDKVVI